MFELRSVRFDHFTEQLDRQAGGLLGMQRMRRTRLVALILVGAQHSAGV